MTNNRKLRKARGKGAAKGLVIGAIGGARLGAKVGSAVGGTSYKMTSARQAALKKAQKASANVRKRLGK